MRYGQMMAVTVLGAFVAAAPFAAQAQTTKEKIENKMEQAKDSAKSTTQEAKTAVSDSWVTSKAKIALFADERVKGIEGAKSVKNDLQVVAPAARKAVDANDKDIAKAVETRMTRDAQLKKVDVRADGGVVTLTGEVPSITAAAKASEQARMVSGVKSVKNELTVRSANK